MVSEEWIPSTRSNSIYNVVRCVAFLLTRENRNVNRFFVCILRDLNVAHFCQRSIYFDSMALSKNFIVQNS